MTIGFSLQPKPPFRLDLTAWALRRRPSNAVDRWDGQTYRRALILNGKPCEVAVTQIAAPDSPRLRVTIAGTRLTSDAKVVTTSFLERLLGIWIDLTEFYRQAARDPNLGPLAQRFRGLKPPRFPTLFEALANGIALDHEDAFSSLMIFSEKEDPRSNPRSSDENTVSGGF
jgi:DNA-3-methyladenine glycosylase II